MWGSGWLLLQGSPLCWLWQLFLSQQAGLWLLQQTPAVVSICRDSPAVSQPMQESCAAHPAPG